MTSTIFLKGPGMDLTVFRRISSAVLLCIMYYIFVLCLIHDACIISVVLNSFVLYIHFNKMLVLSQ